MRSKLVALTLVTPLLACGGGGGSSPTGASQTPAPTPAPTPTPEPIAFGPGQYLVGSQVEAGRYFADPRSGCFWERLSGLGGSLSDVLANNFTGFDSPQEIVDILPGDLAFSADDDCGDWFTTARHGLQTGIPPGRWLVGAQVTPGVYQVNAGDGCYGERVSSFDGNLRSIIANDFVSGGGPQLVEVHAGDVGFYTDDDCGAWSVSTAAGVSVEAQSRGTIEENWRRNREQ